MNTDTLWRIFRTGRHLRPSQVAWRLRYFMERKLPCCSARSTLPADHSIDLRSDFPSVPVLWSPETDHDLAQRLAEGKLRVLNREERLGYELPDWHLGLCKSQRLWTITLHYHEWLCRLAEVAASDDPQSDEAFRLFKHYLPDWLLRCDLESPGVRDLAWNAYAIATRITWWVRSYGFIPRTFWDRDAKFEKGFLASLWKQAAYLCDHLEFDLLANHLLRDAVGLAWAGRFFDAPEARRWMGTATRIAVTQAEEQVMPDGGHFERSPMYHLHVMNDLLVLAHLLEEDCARKQMRSVWQRMAGCLAWTQHPDGKIPLLNDAALNGSCTPMEMFTQGEALGWSEESSRPRGGSLFQDWGLFVWHGNPWAIFFDVGPIGVDYQPGHGHADTLTMEASFRGQRLWVDPGTWGYDLDDRRTYDRSTAAHNTVCVDECDSSEVWHIFRCGRRAYPLNATATVDDRGFSASAGHDGYRHLSGSPYPTRGVTLHPDQRLVITDRCDGQGVHRLSGGWLLAPGWTAEPCDGGWRVSRPECGSLKVSIAGPSGLRLAQSLRWYHPEFGQELVTTRLEWTVKAVLPAEITTVQEPD